jgi:hypothetical protein
VSGLTLETAVTDIAEKYEVQRTLTEKIVKRDGYSKIIVLLIVFWSTLPKSIPHFVGPNLEVRYTLGL